MPLPFQLKNQSTKENRITWHQIYFIVEYLEITATDHILLKKKKEVNDIKKIYLFCGENLVDRSPDWKKLTRIKVIFLMLRICN